MMELPLHLQRLLTVGGLKISWVNNIVKKYGNLKIRRKFFFLIYLYIKKKIN